ncbi:MAG: hypothetical protein GX970_00005 [Phyllobacteriaceae bacterium]|nr:hypothetical protein [Phyllobacteriaceae bacterium]
MSSLVSRFHLLLLGVTLAVAGVIVINVPSGYAFPAHWSGNGADWLWPRDIAIAVPPIIQAVLIALFFVLGKSLTKNHFAKTQHILDPALTLLLSLLFFLQLGLLFLGIGSDFDLFRGTAFGFAANLLVLAVIIFEAERHSYAGLRMPWPIPSDRTWLVVHRTTGIFAGICAVLLAFLGWQDPGPGVLVMAIAAVVLLLPSLALLLSLVFRRL